MPADTMTGRGSRAAPVDSPSLFLETPGEAGPSYFHNEVRVSGQSLDAERVTVELVPLDADGNPRAGAAEGGKPLQGSVEPSKGRFDLLLRTAACPRGAYSLNVRAEARAGGELQARRTITIEPYDEAAEPSAEVINGTAIVVSCQVPGSQHPEEPGVHVFVRGWCYAGGGIDRVVAFLDGRFRHDVLFPVPRPDVEKALGRADALLSGFALPLDAEACPPGEHALTLLVAASDGRRAGRSLTFRSGTSAEEPDKLQHASHAQEQDSDVTVDPSMDRSELLERCKFESLRATIAERHAFVSLTESNVVAEAYHALERSTLALQQELQIAQRAREEAEQRAAAAEDWLEDLRRSLSWRITEPLRSAKQAARRFRH